MHPLNALAAVLLLFPVQDQLHKHLLQLLIAVVDAELLKAGGEREREGGGGGGGEGGQVKEIG